MADTLKPATDAARSVAEAITGPGTPDSVTVVQRQDKLTTLIKALSGPAVCGLLVAFAFLTANWVPFLGDLGIWTALTEPIRAQGVVIALVILAACVGVVLWVAHVGRPSRTEISAGPASLKIEQGPSE
jgi:hypothetical protein